MRPFGNTFRSLESRNYQLFFWGQGFSLIGTWITQTASIWLTYELTQTGFWLGMVGFASRAPIFFLTPFVGVLADRWDRRRVLVVTQTLSMAQSFALACLALTHTINVWHLLFLSAFQGLVNAVDITTRQAFVADLVESRERLANAIALNASMFSAARLLGPAAAGLLIVVTGGVGICFLIDGISYLGVVLGLLAMRFPRRACQNKPDQPFWPNLRAGFQYVSNNAPIANILLLIALVSFVGRPVMVLTPIFADQILQGGAQTMGILMSASGLGALGGALYLSSRPSVVGLGKVMAWASGVFALALITFARSTNLALSLGAMFVLGLTLVLQSASGNSILQTLAPPDKRGRVMSFYTLAFISTVTFGNLAAGLLVGPLGAPNTLTLGGLMCLVGCALFTLQVPSLNQLLHQNWPKALGDTVDIKDG